MSCFRFSTGFHYPQKRSSECIFSCAEHSHCSSMRRLWGVRWSGYGPTTWHLIYIESEAHEAIASE